MLHSSSKILLVPALCAALTACSSGGGSSGTSSPSGSDAAGETGQSKALLNEISRLDYTDPSLLPQDSGSAQYRGVLDLRMYAADQQPGEVLSGDLTMDVQFAGADPISGAVSNIANQDSKRYQGTLSLGASNIDRGGNPELSPTYWVELGGNMTGPEGTPWAVESTMVGNFYGSAYSHTAGEVLGGACSAQVCVELGGGFSAKR